MNTQQINSYRKGIQSQQHMEYKITIIHKVATNKIYSMNITFTENISPEYQQQQLPMSI